MILDAYSPLLIAAMASVSRDGLSRAMEHFEEIAVS